jgi:MFS family permease
MIKQVFAAKPRKIWACLSLKAGHLAPPFLRSSRESCSRGIRLQVIRLCLALLLATLDTTIISTSLITIASELGHFDQASWILVSYLLTYSGFLLIFTRLSDVLGRKPMLLFSVMMFLVWSIGCGFSRTLTQL